jgi:hypothetical protein
MSCFSSKIVLDVVLGELLKDRQLSGCDLRQPSSLLLSLLPPALTAVIM